MASTSVSNKRVLIVHWKKNQLVPFEVFSSLKNFCLSYTQFSYNTLSNYLSRGKKAYDTDGVRIERKNVFLKPKSGKLVIKRKITPVVRKSPLGESDDYASDLTYWLNKPLPDRLAAVTFLVRQSMFKGQRMDKSILVKRKLRA